MPWHIIESLLSEYIRVAMESVCPEFALYSSRIECTRTDTIIFPSSDLSEGRFLLTNLQGCYLDNFFYAEVVLINCNPGTYDLAAFSASLKEM